MPSSTRRAGIRETATNGGDRPQSEDERETLGERFIGSLARRVSWQTWPGVATARRGFRVTADKAAHPTENRRAEPEQASQWALRPDTLDDFTYRADGASSSIGQCFDILPAWRS